MKRFLAPLAALLATLAVTPAPADPLESAFRQLPADARRLTGPLFWLHGDESPERLREILTQVAAGGNGSFTAESRPHKDWLGEGWYRDLAVCLDAAKQHNLHMWIFDEDWWPSQTIAGKVPATYAAKKLTAETTAVNPSHPYSGNPATDPHFIALVAGQGSPEAGIDPATLTDLTPLARNGPLTWSPPAGDSPWQVITFRWQTAPKLQQGGRLAVDGMSQNCVDWYIQTVYQPHYDRFAADFGKTIPGFFYDEPETPGDWGTELAATMQEMNIPWMPAFVAWTLKLTGEAQTAALHQYAEARAETWGRTLYGSLSQWCRQHGVQSIGHFMEHGMLYMHPDFCAGDIFRLMKYSDMGSIDMVCRQLNPGQRPADIYQTPKIGSSLSHTYGKTADIAMCEIYGGYNQNLTYPEMKWLCDHHQLRGINFLIPHSFNPRAPNDTDYPPYFYNGGFEPRFALYRVWADYSSRLSLLLTGGHHVCPVAILFNGNTARAGKYTSPEHLTTALQDSLYDCDWLPSERFESPATSLTANHLALHGERYRVLVIPPSAAITHASLTKAKAFLDHGGIVIGHGTLPHISLTPNIPSSEITRLCETIWGPNPLPATTPCLTTPNGGKAYFLTETPTPAEIAACLANAGVNPLVRVLAGDTGNWLHALRRVDPSGREVVLLANQHPSGPPRTFTLQLPAWQGSVEAWDAMRNEITTIPTTPTADGPSFTLSLAPNQSLLLRQGNGTPQPTHLALNAAPTATLPVQTDPAAPPHTHPISPSGQRSPCPGTTLLATTTVPVNFPVPGQRAFLTVDMPDTAEDAAAVHVNGTFAGGFIGQPHRIDITHLLKPGTNSIRIEPFPVTNPRIELF